MKGVTWGQCYVGLIVRGNDLDLQAPKAIKGVTGDQHYVQLLVGGNDLDLQAVKGVTGNQCYIENDLDL